MKHKIGVLGGIGPEACAEFYTRLIRGLQKRGLVKRNIAPDRLRTGNMNFYIQPYLDGLKELEKNNVDFIVIICNTLYLFYDRLAKITRVPIINLCEEVRKEIKRRRINLLAVIGSKNVISKKLYNFSEVDFVKISKSDIRKIENAINSFNLGIKKRQQIKLVKEICEKYAKYGATILLGCKLALMLKNPEYINSITILVNATINKFIELKHLAKTYKSV